MDWSQYLYITALALALILGRPGATIAAVLLINLAWTMTISNNPVAVGVIDIISCAVLIGASARANVIAAIFAAMVPVYVIGATAGLPNAATYAIIDCMAYAQLGVAGGLDRGMGRAIAFARRRRASNRGAGFDGGEAGRLDSDGSKKVERR